MISGRFIVMGAVMTALSACGGGSKGGPDEFSILPTKPLETPEDLTFLPQPVPGARNRVDRLPLHDGVAALGGAPALLDSDKINSGEQAIISGAGRYGVTANVRQLAAAEDAKQRKNKGPRLLERLAGKQVQERTYRRDILDRDAEGLRLDSLGIARPKP